MDFTKLTLYERQHYDRMCQIEEKMATENDFNEIHNFFKGM
jgi:alpha-N-acetylglucosamine transferase